MAKNYIKQIAQMLDIEIGKEFILRELEGWIFKFTDYSLVCTKGSWADYDLEVILAKMIHGDYEIIKLPWEPKIDDEYWTYFSADFHVSINAWRDRPSDFARLKCGLVFRTGEEAEKARPQKYKELTGRDYDGN